MTNLNPREAALLPTVGSGIEDLIKTLPGVSSNNELSSQYTVRGGNFDENLVYVNGIEVYRPFNPLWTAGGLSFLTLSWYLLFHFLPEVLLLNTATNYRRCWISPTKKPEETAGSVSLSLLGADVHLEGRSKKLTYLVGARYKTTQYVLNALETKGAYRPNFIDIQSFLTYQINPKWELNALGYFSRNKYQLIPESRQTDFGTFQEAYR